MSQFNFLSREFREIFAHAARAEAAARSDPRAGCFYARLALETIVDWLYGHERLLIRPYENTLAARIFDPTFRDVVGPDRVAKARIVKDLGNQAAHETRPVAPGDAVLALRELFHLGYWLTRTYGSGPAPNPDLTFAPDALPHTQRVPVASLKQLQEAAKLFSDAIAARDEEVAKRKASETERERLEAELKATYAQIEALKKVNTGKLDTHDYSEAETRVALIDVLLREAGWKLAETRDREFEVAGMPNQHGVGYVDYVLWGEDGKPLGLVEAKRTTRDPDEGKQQAKLYAECLEKTFGQRPVIFYTNGYETWMWDDARYPPREMQGFLTRSELELMIARRITRKSLATEAIDGKIVERTYQHRAIRRVTEGFDRDNVRKALLVMATGSGKTRTVIALADLLMRANWVRRVLFLADRTALVNQAVNAFKAHLPSSSPVNLVTEKSGHGFVYVSTYQTMMNLIDEVNDGERRFGPGHFDLVVVDEAHRSVYRKFGAIFRYFDSLLVGLTATPKDEVDRDTYRLFDLEKGMPTDAYTLDEAVADGFLVPPRGVSVPLKFQREGINYDELSDEEKAEWDYVEWSEDDHAPPPDAVAASALNNWLFNADTVDKVLKYLVEYGIHVSDGDRIGKTIIFAKNHAHAKFIVERFDVNYPHLKGAFCRVIDYATEYAQSLIDDFERPEKAPHIVVSVDMLDTGIDVPDIVNLVFFKQVRSKTKFWQMLGRGTRLRHDLFGPGRHKTEFRVFDFCMNLEYFNQKVAGVDGKVTDSLSKRLFMARVDLLRALAASGSEADCAELGSATVKRLHSEVAGMNLDNFEVRPHRRSVEKYAVAEAWNDLAGDDVRAKLQGIAGLPSSLSEGDLAARQFDLLVVRAQFALLEGAAAFEQLRERIVDFAQALDALSNVPLVRAQHEFILELLSKQYWVDVTLHDLEEVRVRLRGLITLIDFRKQPRVYTDFEDTLGEVAEVSLLPGSAVFDVERFKARARAFVKAHEDHLAIQKLRRNEPLTPMDLSELERMFVSEGVASDEELSEAAGGDGLGIFIRTLVGLDRAAAARAFEVFQSARTLTGNQLEFIGLIVEYLTARGIIEPKLLFEPPFTDANNLGVAGLFNDDDQREIVRILDDIRNRAVA